MTGCRTSTRCRIPTTISNTCCTPIPDNVFDRQLCLRGPPQATPPIHDHRWALPAYASGAEENRAIASMRQAFRWPTVLPDDSPRARCRKVSSRDGDIHRVSNALAESVSISIHVYGGTLAPLNAVHTPEGLRQTLYFRLPNRHLPNIWGFPAIINMPIHTYRQPAQVRQSLLADYAELALIDAA